MELSADLIEKLTENLPEPLAARRFYEQLAEKFPSLIKFLGKNPGLLSDVLTIAAFSPLLSTTLLQNLNYFAWLNQQRKSAKVRDKEEILESLARFALTNSGLEANVLLARFRRRELLRIFLQDIRNLETIAEITEEISNLADAILEYALRLARQQLDNRYGIPLETDEKNRAAESGFCIVALGKLGSKELNYASDIDLLFLYSGEGATSGQGTRGTVTNREYFVKLSEFIVKLVGSQTGEGAAYRVDLRLRPNGRVGSLAISLKEAVEYYKNSARDWERQVLIRSRASAGDAGIFQKFFAAVETSVFSKNQSVETALKNVRLSKEKINLEKSSARGFDVKTGRGGIRDIEFISQALQLAYGGRDSWLRPSHTLISLARLSDRGHLTETELTELANAYRFLRRLEHRLQMENGLQTHLVSENEDRRLLLAKRMDFNSLKEFKTALETHTKNVDRIFLRVFGAFSKTKSVAATEETSFIKPGFSNEKPQIEERQPAMAERIFLSIEKSDLNKNLSRETLPVLNQIAEISPHFTQILAANPNLAAQLPDVSQDFEGKNYSEILLSAVSQKRSFAEQISVLRKTWSRLLLEIVAYDVFEKIHFAQSKKFQTDLAEASIECAVFITRNEMKKRFSVNINRLDFAVLGLGKLGGGGLDYNSDLDLVLIYDDEKSLPVADLTRAEFYSRAVEIFVNALSSFTREGHLYRVDLRLRPDGRNGATSTGSNAFFDYLKNRSAIWEWLAYIKLRAVGGDLNLAESVETKARNIIHENARKLKIQNSNLKVLQEETRRIRERLEEEKSASRWRVKEIDVKFGAGGMLDVYFAVRFLQLRDNITDAKENRSTLFTLEKLYQNKSLTEEDFEIFFEGYKFLSELDHNLRLTVGRSTRLPLANQTALQTITGRMKLKSISDLLENLTFHRLNIRSSFENILKT